MADSRAPDTDGQFGLGTVRRHQRHTSRRLRPWCRWLLPSRWRSGRAVMARTAEADDDDRPGPARSSPDGRYDAEFRTVARYWWRPGTGCDHPSRHEFDSDLAPDSARGNADAYIAAFRHVHDCCPQSRPTSVSTGRRRWPISSSTDPGHIRVTTSSTSSACDLYWRSDGDHRPSTLGAVGSSALCNRTSSSPPIGASRCRTPSGAAPG